MKKLLDLSHLSIKMLSHYFHKIFFNSRFLIDICFYLLQAADDADTSDKELMSKLITVVFKCFKDADWGKYHICNI